MLWFVFKIGFFTFAKTGLASQVAGIATVIYHTWPHLPFLASMSQAQNLRYTLGSSFSNPLQDCSPISLNSF
jgi:hypothetical protein